MDARGSETPDTAFPRAHHTMKPSWCGAGIWCAQSPVDARARGAPRQRIRRDHRENPPREGGLVAASLGSDQQHVHAIA